MFKTILKIIILTILPALAFAHSPLKSVDPIDKATLTEAPTEYKMIFKSPAKLIKFEILKQAEEKDKKPLPLKLNHKPSKLWYESHVVKLPKISTGSYEVRWRAMGEDGHVLKGILNFEVKGE
jgi:methionine-rich copper-binding protein CopC